MTPAGVSLDGITDPPGWLRPAYEAAYVTVTRAMTGLHPVVRTDHLARSMSATAALGSAGTFVQFTRYPDRPPEPDGRWLEPRPDRLFWIRTGEAGFAVVARRSPYALRHGLLVADGIPQDAAERPLTLALELIRALGPAYTGTFNVAGRTHDGFHAQFFNGSAPLWGFVGSRMVRFGAYSVPSGTATASRIGGWPCECLLITGADARGVAGAVTEEAKRVAAMSGTFDISYRWRDGRFDVLFFPRRCDPSDRRGTSGIVAPHLGTMGALESCGWVLSVRERDAFERITAGADGMATAYREAMAAVTLPAATASKSGTAPGDPQAALAVTR